VEEAYELVQKLDFKLSPEPGMNGKKCRVVGKARQPKVWLFWKGEWGACGALPFEEKWKLPIGTVYTVYLGEGDPIIKMGIGRGEEFAPGEVGATRYEKGILVIVDKGFVTFGAQKVWYNEYFLESIAKNGKFAFSKVRVNCRGVHQPLMRFPERKIVPGKFEIVWDFWTPKDQDPYAVKRGRREGWVPPKNFIPIPKYWIEENPERFQDWLEWVKEKWRVRKELLKARVPYSLFQVKWKGQKVVRDIPFYHFYFNIKTPKGIRLWELRNNPLRTQPTMATYIGKMPEKYWLFEGFLKPLEWLNPKKRLKAEVRILSSGTAHLKSERVERKEDLTLTFTGLLKGTWKLTQEDPHSSAYLFRKLTAHKAKAYFVLQKHSWKGGRHWDIRVDSGGDALEEWSLKVNPVEAKEEEEMPTVPKKCYDKTWMTAEGKREVNGVLTSVEILDSGLVTLLESNPDFKSFIFQGKKLKGYFVLKKRNKHWVFMRSRLPGKP